MIEFSEFLGVLVEDFCISEGTKEDILLEFSSGGVNEFLDELAEDLLVNINIVDSIKSFLKK